jgi:hypothetical protein
MVKNHIKFKVFFRGYTVEGQCVQYEVGEHNGVLKTYEQLSDGTVPVLTHAFRDWEHMELTRVEGASS